MADFRGLWGLKPPQFLKDLLKDKQIKQFWKSFLCITF